MVGSWKKSNCDYDEALCRLVRMTSSGNVNESIVELLKGLAHLPP
ncbi:hypothetical protein MLPF_3378 [Mycobacterium lepromatosis]|nr:hypothetical protein MLPF_3378 [Mycobacterium lepromatosis]